MPKVLRDPCFVLPAFFAERHPGPLLLEFVLPRPGVRDLARVGRGVITERCGIGVVLGMLCLDLWGAFCACGGRRQCRAVYVRPRSLNSMRVALTCKSCQHRWAVVHEPRRLSQLVCPGCQKAAHGRAAEDFASALEDAMSQLWLLGQSVAIDVQLQSEALPAAFGPPQPPAAPVDPPLRSE